MFEVLLVTLSIIASSWSIYNSILGVLGITWRKNYEEKEFSGIYFTIIVPAKNEEKVIGRLLERLVNQEYDKSKLEIIVAEDSSTDSTLEICKLYQNRYEFVKCIHLEPSNVPNGKSRALNYALKIAKGDIIGIFDADTVPRLDVLSYVAPKFKDHNVAAVQGMLLPINVRESIITRFSAIEELIYEYSIAGRARAGFFIPLEGTASFIRKDILMSLGGFNEYNLTEDLDLSIKLILNGYKIIYSPSIISWREVPVRLKTLIKQRLRWYRGHLELSLNSKKFLIKWKVIDAILIVFTPIFVIMNIVNYSLALLFPNLIVIFAIAMTSLASIVSFILVILISRLHMIELFYPILSLLYFNFIVGLNFIAILMEVFKYPRFWVKTERSGRVTI
jgi:cellulose synthase/poly-beta-1,6-N-acetylglucosamine synthase-like glycosyltransferase